jgi:hypothetical protein
MLEVGEIEGHQNLGMVLARAIGLGFPELGEILDESRSPSFPKSSQYSPAFEHEGARNLPDWFRNEWQLMLFGVAESTIVKAM